MSEVKWKKSSYPIPSILDLAMALVSSNERPVSKRRSVRELLENQKKQNKDEAEKYSEITRTYREQVDPRKLQFAKRLGR